MTINSSDKNRHRILTDIIICLKRIYLYQTANSSDKNRHRILTDIIICLKRIYLYENDRSGKRILVDGPKAASSFGWFCTILCVSVIAAFYLKNFVYFLYGFVLSFLIEYLINRYSKLENTWMEEIERLLSLYDPINEDDYKQLMSHIEDNGHIEKDLLHTWLCSELNRVESNIKTKQISNS